MFLLEGTVLEIQEIPAKPAEGTRAARPAYALAQIVGTVVTFDGAQKKKIFDAMFKTSEPVKPFLDKKIRVPVDIYGTGKGTISVRHLDGTPVVAVNSK